MDSSSAPEVSPTSPPPFLPPLKSFSSCFLVLEALRSTTERIQKSLVVHYSNLCRDCERKSISSSTLAKKEAEEEERKIAEGIVKENGNGGEIAAAAADADSLDSNADDAVIEGIRSIRRSTETEDVVASGPSKTEPIGADRDGAVVVEETDVKVLPASLEDDGGLPVEDDFIQPIQLTPPRTNLSKTGKGSKLTASLSSTSSSSSSKNAKGKSLTKKTKDDGDDEKKTEKAAAASASKTSESLKRKREEEIERIQNKIKKMRAYEGNKEVVDISGGVDIGDTGNSDAEDGVKKSTAADADVVGDDDKSNDHDAEIDEKELSPPIPEFIKSMMMSEPKLRNFQQISTTLYRELGDVDYRQVVDCFEAEFEREKAKAKQNLLAVSNPEGRDSDAEPILPCKFSFTCNMGKSCNRRHPNTLAEPDKVLLMRLEDEAGRRLVPRWLRIKDKLMRSFGQSLREKKQKLGQAGFERATRIAEAYYKYEANRKISRRCQFGVKCDIYFCGGSHPHRTSEISGQEFFLYVMDKYSTGYYDEYLFPPFETLFPSFINVERHINYVCCLLRYRRDIGAGLYETVLQELEEELPKEKLKKNKKAKCTHSFAMCKFKSACKYAHQDAFNDIKVLCDMLKEAKAKVNVERLTK